MKKMFSLILPCLMLLCATMNGAEYLGEIKVGYFRPTSDVLRDIFPDGWINYQAEVSYSPFDRSSRAWWRNFFAWGSVNYMHVDGDTTVGIDDCEMDILPVALGLKYVHPLPCCAKAYASAGLKYYWLHVDNKDEITHLKDRAQGLGGAFALGALFHPTKNLFFDFFVDYSVKHFDESNFSVKENDIIPVSIDISGITFGIGAGWWF